jgi:hypothetical protein
MILIIILLTKKENFMVNQPSKRMLENRIEDRLKRIRQIKPFITDALTHIERVCGNPNCKCAKGEKHGAWILTFKEKGKTKSLYVPVDLAQEVQKWSKEAKWIKKTIQEVNLLQRQIIRQYVERKRAESRGKKKLKMILEKI